MKQRPAKFNINRTMVDTRYTIGFELRVPVDQAALKLPPLEKDEWAKEFVRACGYKPGPITHLYARFEGSIHPVAMIIWTYAYKRLKL